MKSSTSAAKHILGAAAINPAMRAAVDAEKNWRWKYSGRSHAQMKTSLVLVFVGWPFHSVLLIS
jgi:hypothetical protein